MKKAWADPEHVGKITISILDILSKEFHIEAKKGDDEKNFDNLIKLSQAAGYQSQLYSGLQKSHEFAKRLKRIEKELDLTDTQNVMLQNPVIAAEEELKTNSKLV